MVYKIKPKLSTEVINLHEINNTISTLIRFVATDSLINALCSFLP